MPYLRPVDWPDILERKEAPPGFERIDEEEAKRKANEERNQRLIEMGAGTFETWTSLAYQEPPKDLLGRILWSAGVLGQLVISIFTFPAALGAFLLEEAVQTYGMGAYMLSTAKDYETLDRYLDGYRAFIDGAEIGAKNLATLSPVTGGAVLLYLGASRVSHAAFQAMTDKQLLVQAEKDEAARERLLYLQTYGSLAIRSSPTNAEIWIDGENTEYLTSETFKGLEEKTYIIELRKYSKKREAWDIYTFEADVTAGRKKEIFIHIPPTIISEEEEEEITVGGDLSIKSTPSSAEIWMDGENTNLLTPERFKAMRVKEYTIQLRAWSRKLAVWDEYEFKVVVEKNRNVEVKVNIPGKAFDKIVEGLTKKEEEEDQLDDFVKAEVTGDYAVDGDTFQTTAGERIRILGIDTPELGRPWADMAKEYTYSLIEDKKIQLRIQTHLPIDAYGRTLAICESYKGNIAILLLSAGLARAFIADDARYDPARYLEAERVARDRRIGIWSEMP